MENLFLNASIGIVALYVLQRILNSFIQAASRDRESQNQAIQTLASLIGTISSQIDMNRQVVDRNNDLIEKTNMLISQMASAMQKSDIVLEEKIDMLHQSVRTQIIALEAVLQAVLGNSVETSRTVNDIFSRVVNLDTQSTAIRADIQSSIRNSLAAVVVYDSQGALLAANETSYMIFEEIDLKNMIRLSDVISPGGTVYPRTALPFEMAVNTKSYTPSVFAGVLSTKEQKRVWVRMEAYPVLDAQGGIISIVMFIHRLGGMSMFLPELRSNS